MERKKFDDVLEAVNFMAANMVTKDELENVTNQLTAMNERLTAVESKIAGTNRRLDGEAMERQDHKLLERIAAIEKHLGIGDSINA